MAGIEVVGVGVVGVEVVGVAVVTGPGTVASVVLVGMGSVTTGVDEDSVPVGTEVPVSGVADAVAEDAGVTGTVVTGADWPGVDGVVRTPLVVVISDEIGFGSVAGREAEVGASVSPGKRRFVSEPSPAGCAHPDKSSAKSRQYTVRSLFIRIGTFPVFEYCCIYYTAFSRRCQLPFFAFPDLSPFCRRSEKDCRTIVRQSFS